MNTPKVANRADGTPRPLPDAGVAMGAYEARLERLAASLGRDWLVQTRPTRSIAWRAFVRAETRPSAQGWKIHVSAAAIEAAALCEEVLPYLIEVAVDFKVAADTESIVELNGGNCGLTQTGKIVTVYPDDARAAARIASELDRRWLRSRGPVVPTDLLVRAGGAVSLRYGSFTGVETRVDALGLHQTNLRHPDGTLVPDERSTRGLQPEWAPELPLRTVPPWSPDWERGISVDGLDYLPLGVLHQSPKGMALLALDVQDCSTVVLKMARHGVGGDALGYDAADRLENEYHLLRALARHGFPSPRAIGFSRGEPTVLVLEDVDGRPLSALAKDAQLRSLPRLAELVAHLHELGYVHGDVKFSNALLKEDGALLLMDFEIGGPIEGKSKIPGGSRGHMPSDIPSTTADPRLDAFALGGCLAHATLSCDPGLLPSGPGRCIGLLHLLGAHDEANAIHRLAGGNPASRPRAADLSALFAGLARSPAPPSRRFETRLATKKWVRRAALEAALSTRAYLEPQPVGCAWRNLHMEADFRCEGINLGAAGILLGLMSIDRALHTNRFGNDILGGAAWLADRPPSDEAMGLFSGNAGVALALACVARRFGATGLEDKVRARLRAGPPEMQENDLFAGAAGALWAGCLIANVLQAEWPLEAGERHARWLLDSVQEIDGIICWPPSPGLGEEHPYTGAAHGSAGNAMALAAWGKRTKCSRSLSLAREIFANLHDRSRTEDGSDFRPDVGGEAPAAMARNWCHGTAGYLWCLLQAFGDDPDFHTQVDWAVEVLAPAPSLGNPTYCHGLAGFLELWRMIRTIPRHEGVARRRIRSTAAALRLLGERTSGRFLWCSEDPRTHTPDLWVGFLAPATALALHAEERPDALLSPTWLAEIARRAPDPTCPGSGRDARPGPR